MSPDIARWYSWLPRLSALLMILVFGWLTYSEMTERAREWQNYLSRQEQDQGYYLKTVGRNLSQQAMLLAQLVGRDKYVVAEIRAAQRVFVAQGGIVGSEAVARARANLQNELNKYWLDMPELGVIQLNVFVAPGNVNILRMQRLARYGDGLSELRPLIKQVFNSGIPAWGLDVSREGSGYSAILPVFAEDDGVGDVIAVVELTLSSLPDPTLNDNAVQMALFLKKDITENILWENKIDSINQVSKMTVDDWRLERANSPLIMDWWREGRVPINSKAYRVTSSTGQSYLMSWHTLKNDEASNAPIIAAAMWSDVTAEYRRYEQRSKEIVIRWGAALFGAELLLWLFTRLSHKNVRYLAALHTKELKKEINLVEQAQHRLALALRSSESGFWEWDITNDKAIFSEEWRRLCGLGPASSESQDLDEWLSRVHPADKRASYSEMIRHIKGETPMYENEYRIRVNDGSFKWILTRGRVVERDKNGRALRMLGVYYDITQRKSMELIAVRQQVALHTLNEIASLPSVNTEEQLQKALGLAIRYLCVGSGVISEVKSGRYQVRAQNHLRPNDEIREELAISKTFCSLTLSAKDVVAEDNIPKSAIAAHAAYLVSGTESYIGVPLWIDGELYGTLSFSSRKSRQHEYDRLDKDFVRLLGRWVSSVLERWQQDEEKRIILEQFQKLSERLPGFLYQYQLRPDGTAFFPYASPGIKNIYNATPEEANVSADVLMKVIHPDDLGWIGETISYSATHLTPWVAIVRILNPERGLIWTHVQSIPERLSDGSILWNGYVSDITSLKQTELELESINALSQAIFDAASVSIISADVNGIVKTFNHGAELLLNYSADEIIDRYSLATFHVREELEHRAMVLSNELGEKVSAGIDCLIAKAREGMDDENEWNYQTREGLLVPIVLTVSVLRDKEGEIIGYLGVARDISEIKRIDKMKAEFISTVSHELRTPLTAINGALGLMAGGAVGTMPPASLKMIDIAHKNSQRLILLVNDLLDMEKLVAGKMDFTLERQSIIAIVKNSMEANSAYADKYDVKFVLDPYHDDAVVVTDSLRLQQVMANFLSNAAKFSPPNDVVKIKIVRTFSNVRVSVIDNGKGIPEEFRARIFRKFSQADSSDTRQKGGTGLGLAICKEIIERMHGRVGYNSKLGEGTEFYFDLPCEDFTQKSPGRSVLVNKQKHQVLVVSASALVKQQIAESTEGIDIDLVENSEDAAEYMALRAYNLLVLMGDALNDTAFDFIQQIRKREILNAGARPPLAILIVDGETIIAEDEKNKLALLSSIYWAGKSGEKQDLFESIGEVFEVLDEGLVSPISVINSTDVNAETDISSVEED